MKQVDTKKKIPRNERVCSFCNSYKIEDEDQFLQDCKAYSQIRDVFFLKRETKITDLRSLLHNTLTFHFMNSSEIALKVVFSLSDRYKIFTSNWLWIEMCENVGLVKIGS